MIQQNKKALSERDIRTKYITPALVRAGWDMHTQMREEVYFTDGRIDVGNQRPTRGAGRFADYILYYKPNIPIAVIEAKDNEHTVGAGMQQALGYAEILDIPFVFSSNGDGLFDVWHHVRHSFKKIEIPNYLIYRVLTAKSTEERKRWQNGFCLFLTYEPLVRRRSHARITRLHTPLRVFRRFALGVSP